MSIIPVTIPGKKLAQTISSSDMTFKANNVLNWEGVDLVPGDFGTEAYAVFTNSQRTQIEIIKFDPATIADDSITIISRGLGYSGQDVEDSSRKFPWASNDTTIQFGTDAPQLFRDFLSESNTATITALHEYDVLPQSAVDPTNDEDFTTKSYVDGLTSPAITVNIAQTTHGLVVGNAIKVLGVNTFEKAQADSAANAEVVGIVTVVTDVDNFTYVTEGIVVTGVPVFAAGTVLFLDPDNAGALVDTETNTVGEVNMPLATINESGVRMTFHKYRPIANNTIAGNPIATETIAGSVEEATQTEADDKTAVGGTGAKLFVPPSKLRATQFNDYKIDTGAADAYAITPSPAITAYAAGQVFFFKVANTNTGASTLNVSGLGVKTIKKNIAEDLEAGDLTQDQIVQFVYDGTNFQALGIGGGGGVDVQEFASSGTWDKPAEGKRVLVECWGGGGAGAHGYFNGNSNQSGGGGGMYISHWFDIDDLGATETVTIGDGGVGVTTSASSGAAGGATSFGALLTAYGGTGGHYGAGTLAAGRDGGRPYVIPGVYGRGGSDNSAEPSGLYSGASAAINQGSSIGETSGSSVYGGGGGGGVGESNGIYGPGASKLAGAGGVGRVNAAAGNGEFPSGGGGAVGVPGTGTHLAGSGGDGQCIVTVF